MSTNTTSVCRKRLKELEIVVVIPTYNNGKTLAAVIEEVCRYAGDIIVVNDGSFSMASIKQGISEAKCCPSESMVMA